MCSRPFVQHRSAVYSHKPEDFFEQESLWEHLRSGALLGATRAPRQQDGKRRGRCGEAVRPRGGAPRQRGCGGGTCFYVLQPALACQCVPPPARASVCICASPRVCERMHI